jgi:hypothetical protein
MSLLLLALAIITPAPRDTVRYAVTFPDAAHHETRIAVDFPAAGARSGRFCDSRPIRGWRCARPNTRG